jgi:hypothetical protein
MWFAINLITMRAMRQKIRPVSLEMIMVYGDFFFCPTMDASLPHTGYYLPNEASDCLFDIPDPFPEQGKSPVGQFATRPNNLPERSEIASSPAVGDNEQEADEHHQGQKYDKYQNDDDQAGKIVGFHDGHQGAFLISSILNDIT